MMFSQNFVFPLLNVVTKREVLFANAGGDRAGGRLGRAW